MSTVNGFQVGSETLKYNYESLENYNTPNFSSSSSKIYAIGDYVTYNGKLYKCTTATTGGTWNANNWTEAILSDDVSDAKNAIDEIVLVQDTQPLSADNRIWVDPDDNEIEIPTMDELDLIGESSVLFALPSETVNGTGAWNGKYIDTGIIPVSGETYYLQIGNVVDCKTNVCARINFRSGSTIYSYIELTLDDVANGAYASKTIDNNVDRVQLILFRNNSASTVEAGSTVFTNVKITRKVPTESAIATASFNLTENADFNGLKNGINDFTDQVSDTNLEYYSASDYVTGTNTWLSKYITLDNPPATGNKYYLHIDNVINCKTNICARLELRNGNGVYTFAELTLDDVANGRSVYVIAQANDLTSCKVALYRNASASTVSPGITIFNGIRVTRNSEDITYSLKMPVATYWKNKKVVWFGTSIPAGSYDDDMSHRYPNIVGSLLGATVYNEAVGSSSISRTIPSAIVQTVNPYGFDTTDFEYAARCLTNTAEMQEWLIANYNSGFFTTSVPSDMSDYRKTLIRSYSYEQKIDKYLSDGSIGNVDLYVFDQGFNDVFNRDVNALEAEYGIDTRYCYDGGMNFLIRRILTSNPDAKIVIISHYTDNATDRVHANSTFVEQLKAAQLAVCERWGIKFVNIFEKLGWSGQMITTTGYWDATTNEWVNSGGVSQTLQIKDVHVRDTVHPYTDASGKSNNRIAEVIAAEINNLVR